MKYIGCSHCKVFDVVEDEKPLLEKWKKHISLRGHKDAIYVVRSVFEGSFSQGVEPAELDKIKGKVIVKLDGSNRHNIYVYAQPTLKKILAEGTKKGLEGVTPEDGKVQPFRQHYFIGNKTHIQESFPTYKQAEDWCRRRS